MNDAILLFCTLLIVFVVAFLFHNLRNDLDSVIAACNDNWKIYLSRIIAIEASVKNLNKKLNELDQIATTLEGEYNQIAETLRGEYNQIAKTVRGDYTNIKNRLDVVSATSRELKANLAATRQACLDMSAAIAKSASTANWCAREIRLEK